MNGHDHALFGAAAYGGALIAGVTVYDQVLPDASTLVLGGVVAVGAALAADIDEKHSVASQGAGLFGSLTRAVTGTFGGHRTVTHYPLLWIPALTALCFGLINGGVDGSWLGVVCGVFAALGFPFLAGPKRRSALGPLLDVLTVAVGVAVWWGVTHFEVQADWWMYAAIPVPYLAHLIGDFPTPSGIPALWPLSNKSFGFKLFHSGGWFENTVVAPALTLACVWCAYRLTQLA